MKELEHREEKVYAELSFVGYRVLRDGRIVGLWRCQEIGIDESRDGRLLLLESLVDHSNAMKSMRYRPLEGVRLGAASRKVS